MKKQILILAISLFTLTASAQSSKSATIYPKVVNDTYVPIEALRILQDDFSGPGYILRTKHSIVYQNYKYSYIVWETGGMVNAELVKKEKLCSRKDFIFHRNRITPLGN